MRRLRSRLRDIATIVGALILLILGVRALTAVGDFVEVAIATSTALPTSTSESTPTPRGAAGSRPEDPPATHSPSPSAIDTLIPRPPTPSPTFTSSPTPWEEVGTVTRVIDGDTIEVSMEGAIYRVRYTGMNTPETDEYCGPEATEVNRSLVGGRRVSLVKDVSETDIYRRLLRYVYVGDIFVNAELLSRGYASAATFPPDVTFASLFRLLESEARQAARGCWALTEPPPPQGSNCHPSYEGVCLPVGIGDFDCTRAGGGNGPNYVEDDTGSPVRVVGPDEFRLDRDNDGLGCE